MSDGTAGGWEYGSSAGTAPPPGAPPAPVAPAAPPAPAAPAPMDEVALSDATATGNYVRLRPLATEDYSMLYFMEQDPAMAQQFRHHSYTIPPERYGEALWAGVDCQFAIESINDGTLVGIVNIHGSDKTNLNARLTILIRPDLHTKAWPLEALPLFIDHVFRVFPFRKLYADVTESVFDTFAAGSGIDFDIEGRLVAHHWIGGKWQDLLVLAVHRSKWENRQAGGPGSFANLLAEEAGSTSDA